MGTEAFNRDGVLDEIRSLAESINVLVDIWMIDDVKEIRPDMTDGEAIETLRLVDKYKDATIGIDWDVIGDYAEMVKSAP